MKKTVEKLEKRYVIPCGAMDVSATGICRRQLKDSFDSLLDRITEEIHPEFKENSLYNKALQDRDNTLEEEPKTTKSKLEGNSKLLQDPTGKINEFR